MKKYLTILLSFIMAMTMAAPAFAAEEKDSIIDTSKTGTITIDYSDDADGVNPVVGAEFRFYKVAEIGDFGNYESIIPVVQNKDLVNKIEINGSTEADDIIDAVKAAYAGTVEGGYTTTVKTDSKGHAAAHNLPLGLYLAEESVPAIEHFASIPFLFSVPYTENNVWNYNVNVEPKSLPASDLVITKSVQGNAGETDRDFHFVVTFDIAGKYHYTKSDGATGTIESGGVITLKNGQTATIDTIPVGCNYAVQEEEANKYGYTTTSSGTTGKIVNKTKSYAKFVNVKNVEKPSGGSSVNKRTQTGDTIMPFIWGAVAVCALVVFIALARSKKTTRE